MGRNDPPPAMPEEIEQEENIEEIVDGVEEIDINDMVNEDNGNHDGNEENENPEQNEEDENANEEMSLPSFVENLRDIEGQIAEVSNVLMFLQMKLSAVINIYTKDK